MKDKDEFCILTAGYVAPWNKTIKAAGFLFTSYYNFEEKSFFNFVEHQKGHLYAGDYGYCLDQFYIQSIENPNLPLVLLQYANSEYTILEESDSFKEKLILGLMDRY